MSFRIFYATRRSFPINRQRNGNHHLFSMNRKTRSSFPGAARSRFNGLFSAIPFALPHFASLFAIRTTRNRPVGPLARAIAFAVVALMSFGSNGWAASYTWTGTTTGTWDSTGTNWLGTPTNPWDVTNGPNNVAIFGLASLAATVSGSVYTNGITFTTGGRLSGGTINLAGTSPGISVASSQTATISTLLAGSAGLVKTGAGTLILNGSAVNTYTGATTINLGTLTLDFANLGTPTDLLKNTSTLAMGGGTLSVLGKNTGTTSQTLASTALNSGASIIAPNRGTGTSTTLNLGAVTGSAGSTISFQPTTAWAGGGAGTMGTASTTEIVTVSSVSRPGGAITMPGAGSFAYIGANAFNGTGANTRYLVAKGAAAGPYQLVGAPSSTTFVTTGGSATTVYNITGGQTLTGAVTNYGLLGNNGSAATIALANNAYTLNGYIGIQIGTTTISTAGSGTLVVGAERDFVANLGNSGGLTISAPIVNNGGGASNVTLTTTGTGILTLSGPNTYSGVTTINSGTLAIALAATESNGAASSVLGAIPGSATPGKLVFNGGTLSITPGDNISMASNRGILVNAGGGTMKNTAAKTISTSAIIAGTGAMTFDVIASGGWTLGGANTFSGGATLTGAGSFFIAHNTAFGSGTLTLSGPQVRGSTAGTYTLANAVNIAANTTFTSVGGENTLTFSGPAVLTGGSRTLTANIGSSVANKATVFSGGISEDVAGRALTKAGAGTLILSGASTYTGATTVSAGRLALTKNTALYNNNTGSWTAANITVASGATLALNVGTSGADFTSANIDTIAGLGTASTGFVSGSFLGLDTTTADFTYASNLVNPNAGVNTLGVIKLGSNKLTLSGASNSYTGLTMIGGGTLVAGSTSAFGAAGNDVYFMTTPAAGSSGGQLAGGNLELATDSSVNAYDLNGTSSFASTLILNRATAGTGITQNLGNWIAGNNVLNVTKGANVSSGTATVSFTGMSMGAGSGGSSTLTPTDTNISITGQVNSTTNNAKTLVLDGTIAGNSISGDISNGSNTLSLTKSGASTWTLSGTNNYTGATAVNAGTLKAGSTTGLSSSSAFTTADVATAILDLDGYNNTVGSLAGGGATGGNVALGIATLTTGVNNTSTSYAGNISGGGNLIKTGTGVFTLSGTANGYTGATSVNAGTLVVNSTLASSGTTVANLATLGGTGTLSGAVTVSSGGTLSPATSVTAGTLTLGSLTLDLGSNLAYEFGGTSDLISVTNASGLTINGGALSLYAAGGVTPLIVNGTYSLFSYSTAFGGALSNLSVLNSQAGKTYAINDTGSLIQLVLGTATTSDWSGSNGDGLWTTDGLGGNWNGGSQPNALGAVANFGSLAGTPQTVTLNGGKTVGSILFDNSNAFTIGTTSDAITLNNGIAAGAIGVTSGNHAINAPIILAGPANIAPATETTLTLAGDISGSKSLTLTGAGTTILAGTNSYTTTTISAGKLQIGDGVAASGTLGSGAVSLASGTTLEFNRTGSYSAPNDITGPAATLTMTNGAVTLSGTKSLSVLNLNGGSPVISGTNTITTANLGGGTGTISGTNAITSLGVTGGDTGVSGATITTANVSGGTVTFSGTNTLTTINLSGGTAKAGSGTGFGSTATLVLTGTGTLDLNGNNVGFIGNVPIGVAGNTITDNAAGTGTSTVTFGQTGNTNITTAALIIDGATRKVGVAFTNNNSGQQFSNANNTFSGGLTLLNTANGTRIQIASAPVFAGTPGALTSGTYGTGTITVGQASTDKAGIYISAANITLANAVVANTGLGTDRVGTFRIDTTGNTFSGQLTAGESDFTLSTNGTGAVNLTGKITGSNGLKLLSHNLGGTALTVTLTNAVGTNDYAGNTTINDNAQTGKDYTLVLGAADQIPNGTGKGNVVINTNGTGDGTLNLGGFSDTINGLSGSGTVTTTVAGASVLTLGDNDATSSFSGTITESVGTVGIIKIGSGDQTFSNTSSYTGGTRIDAGKLILGHSTNTLANGGAVNINGGELALGTNTDTVGAVTLTSGSITGSGAGTLTGTGSNYDVRSGSVSAKLGGTIGLDKSTPGTVTLSGVNAYSGTTTVSEGTLEVTGSINSTGAVVVTNNGSLLVGASNSINDVSVSLGGSIVRASGVSETFGALTLTTDSTLNFGSGATGILTFGTYTPSSLLSITNFAEGNILRFVGSDLTSQISTPSLFSFDNGFTSSWNSGTSTFEIIAVPEPGTILAGLLLLGGLFFFERRRIAGIASCVRSRIF